MEKFRLKVRRKVKENRGMELSGSQKLRTRLLLWTQTLKLIAIGGIRTDAMPPGLLDHQISLLHLLRKISDGYDASINFTGITNDSKVDGETKDYILTDDVGERITLALLNEIKQGGVMDFNPSGCVRQGSCGEAFAHGVGVLQEIDKFLGLKFDITPDSDHS